MLLESILRNLVSFGPLCKIQQQPELYKCKLTYIYIFIFFTLNIFYCSKRQKDKSQVKQLKQSSPITYISKYTIEHNNI